MDTHKSLRMMVTTVKRQVKGMRRRPKLIQFLSFLWGFSFLELTVNMSNMLEIVSETVLGLPGCKDAQRTWIDASPVKSPALAPQ